MKESQTHNNIEIFSYFIFGYGEGGGDLWASRQDIPTSLFFSQPVITQSVKFSFTSLVAITLFLIVYTFSLVFLFYVCCGDEEL